LKDKLVIGALLNFVEYRFPTKLLDKLTRFQFFVEYRFLIGDLVRDIENVKIEFLLYILRDLKLYMTYSNFSFIYFL